MNMSEEFSTRCNILHFYSVHQDYRIYQIVVKCFHFDPHKISKIHVLMEYWNVFVSILCEECSAHLTDKTFLVC